MYCLVYTRSSLCTAALIFYTVVWLPLSQLKKSFLGLFIPTRQLESRFDKLQLPAARFGDLQRSGRSSSGLITNISAGNREEEEYSVACSICLVEMEEEEAVTELPRCGHVFHSSCISRWLERCNLTCPLCRSLLFDPCKFSSQNTRRTYMS